MEKRDIPNIEHIVLSGGGHGFFVFRSILRANKI